MISLYIHHDSSEGEQWGRDQIYPDFMVILGLSFWGYNGCVMINNDIYIYII